MQIDTATLRLAQAGEPAAQTLFLRRCAGPMRALVRRIGSRNDVDDQLQELFVTLLGALPRFSPDGPATLSTWVFAVAHRSILSARRKRKLELVPLDDATEVSDMAPYADAIFARKELQQAIEIALGKLPEEQQRVFVLAQIHEQPLEQIAEVEEVPLGTVKSRLHRARAALVLLLCDRLDAPERGVRHAEAR